MFMTIKNKATNISTKNKLQKSADKGPNNIS